MNNYIERQNTFYAKKKGNQRNRLKPTRQTIYFLCINFGVTFKFTVYFFRMVLNQYKERSYSGPKEVTKNDNKIHDYAKEFHVTDF